MGLCPASTVDIQFQPRSARANSLAECAVFCYEPLAACLPKQPRVFLPMDDLNITGFPKHAAKARKRFTPRHAKSVTESRLG